MSENDMPRFSMPMILMQSVLVPEYSNKPDQVRPVLPTLYRRVFSKPSSANANYSDTNSCRLPFQDRETLSMGKRLSAMSLSSNKTAVSSKIQQKRVDEARKRLNQNLHAEHRVFMEKLKMERASSFQKRTAAAVVVQRYARGLSVRIKTNPEKYASLRASLVTHYTKEELTELVAAAIKRSGVVVA